MCGLVIEFSLVGVRRGWCIWQEGTIGYQGCSIGLGRYEIAQMPLEMPFLAQQGIAWRAISWGVTPGCSRRIISALIDRETVADIRCPSARFLAPENSDPLKQSKRRAF